MSLEYIPQQPKQQPVPAPTYELKKDVTGKPIPKLGLQILKDTRGRQFKVSHPPKDNCKKCLGKGYVGIEVKTDTVLLCPKCYP